MEALFLLIPLSLIALGAAIWIFLRMNASGQFDDAEGPAYSILLDDDDPTRDAPSRADVREDRAP
ncbi:MAG: cbb3-type cytochrome oxidase assembly protein CcoS [Burkholderiaceae bacterium]